MTGFPDNEPNVYNHYLPLGWTVATLTPLEFGSEQWSGSVSSYSYTSANGTNAQLVKNGVAELYVLLAFSKNSNFDRYLRFYDTNVSPTAGSGSPLGTVIIPRGGMALVHSDGKDSFTNGIGFTITGGSGDTDTTAIFANDVVLYIGHS